MFFNGDFTLQLNSESALSHAGASLVKKTLKGGYDVVFGCDIHDPGKIVEYGLEKTQKLLGKLGKARILELEDFERSVIDR